MKTFAAIALGMFFLVGCTTPATIAAGNQYRHPTNGDSKTSNDDAKPSIWTEIFCTPCYYQAKANAYADCKNALEAQGYSANENHVANSVRCAADRVQRQSPLPSVT